MVAALEASGWRAELGALLARFGRLFVRAEPRAQAGSVSKMGVFDTA